MENEYMLILKPNGDIEIWKDGEYTIKELVFHKSYNLGENLEDNLLEAFKFWRNCYN